MYQYSREFKSEEIPHKDKDTKEVIDIIHNYKRPKNNQNDAQKST